MVSAPTPQANPLLDAALAYAAAGFFVLPTHDVAHGRCSCGHDCPSPGKHPRLKHGLNESTTDPTQIAAWWTRWPSANVALDCGRSNIVVVDVDVKKGAQGEASLKWYVERFPDFGRTRVCSTPSGGLHYYFVGAAKTTDPMPGIDVQGRGSIVLAPPSVAFSQYDARKNPVPGSQRPYTWLNDFPMQPYPVPTQTEPGYDFGEQPSKYEGEERSAVPIGQHRAALLRVGWTLRCVLGLDVTSAAKVLDELIRSTDLLEGYDPAHPFSQRDLEGMLKPLVPHVASGPLPVGSTNILDAIEGASDVLARKLPPRQVIIPGLMIQGELHVFYGPDGVGKTSLVAYLLAQVTRLGRDVLVFISEDQPRDFLLKFLLAGGVRERIHFYNAGKNVREFLLPKCKIDLEAMIQSNAWGCIYFDSIGDYKSMDGRLNAADEARQLYGPLNAMAQLYDTAILCTQHTNARDVLEGARQIRAKARVVARVERPKRDDANNLSEDGYDFSQLNPYDAQFTAVVTTEKFSRGMPNKRHAFFFESRPSVDPTSGEVEVEVQPDGQQTPKQQYVCIGYEESKEATRTHAPTTVKDDLEAAIEALVLADPKISSNEVYRRVGGSRNTVMGLVRKAKKANHISE